MAISAARISTKDHVKTMTTKTAPSQSRSVKPPRKGRPKKTKMTPEDRKNWPAKASDGAKKVAQARADSVAKMTPKERQETIAAFDDFGQPIHKPTDDAVAADLLILLNAVGAEFIRRYYPDATNAMFHITKYPEGPGTPIYSVHLPMAAPTAPKA